MCKEVKSFEEKVMEKVVRAQVNKHLEVMHFDANNNCIHYKGDVIEHWCEFDENRNCIHFKDINGYECISEFDQNNKCIHSKNMNGEESWFEYDKNGNLNNRIDKYGNVSNRSFSS